MSNESNIFSAFDFKKDRNWIDWFYRFDIAKFETLLRTKNESFWQKAGERRALELFHAAAERVPAYKDFLKKHDIRHMEIKTILDFRGVPLTDKENYIQAYPLKKRCWDGSLARQAVIPASSGTSGEPKFWPRGGFQEFEAGVIHELIYKNIFHINKHKTLALIGFPMGVYVSGVATVLPTWLVANKKYDLTLMSIGNNKSEMLRAVRNLYKDYSQILLIGHPFFIKDVIEAGKNEGVLWSKMKLGLMFCSEGFSEGWRRYILKQADMSFGRNMAVSTYGSSEMLLMGHETPLSVFVRTALEKNTTIAQKMFGDIAMPDLFQYNPLFRYIESVHDDLVFTSASGIPLVRFNLRDSGKVIPFVSIKKIISKTNADDWELPFVALRGRSDQTIVFYAANIYPEHVKAGLDDVKFYGKLTGKFVMRKDYLKNMDEFLEINIELTKETKTRSSLAAAIQKEVVKKLRKINMEYLDASSRFGEKLIPRIILWPYQHEKHFRPGLKPKYIAKQ
ncbi:MAG TPA: hypothetical protein DEP08_04090 [Candidatus Jacksonbacteria bacterium]|nr:hypothetical protein [Candidatus Jacksonbacteria bacterium]